jgi:hypothetical protein
MENAGYPPGERIKKFALECLDKIKSSSSTQAALKTVADYASPQLDAYLVLTLKNPDEISMHFVDLLDQIIFEITGNIHYNDTVHEYIIEDLYFRLCIYLDYFMDKEVYASNINKRNFTHDDTIIIRQHRMAEYVPQLVTEYYEQPILQKSILRALFNFDSEILLNLYYNIAKDGNFIEEKTLALIGLKRFESKFNFDSLHAGGNDGYVRLVEYAELFNSRIIEANSFPGDLYSLLFALNFIELNADKILGLPAFTWALQAMQPFLNIAFDDRIIGDIYASSSNIILLAGPEVLRRTVRDKELAAVLIRVLDFFPGEFSYKLGKKMSLVKNDFVVMANWLNSSGKIKLNSEASTAMNYILWESGSAL